MAKRIASVSSAIGRGVFELIESPPSAIKAIGTNKAVMIASSLPWGPLDAETDFIDAGTFRATFAPPGFPRTGNAYLTVTRAPWVNLALIRVLGVGAAAGSLQLEDTVGPADAALVHLKYKGANGNLVKGQVFAATDAVGTHRKLVFSITDATTGLSTTETYDNFDFTKSIGDAYYTSTFANSQLIGSITRQAGSTPAVSGPTSFSTGSDGAALVAADYLGTPGDAGAGVALLENDPEVDAFFCDSVPSGILAAVNAGLDAHAVFMADQRIFIASAAQGTAVATVKTAAASVPSDHGIYTYQFMQVFDDVGTLTGFILPAAGFTAALMTLMPPHLSLAYKDVRFTKFLNGIKGIDTIPKQATLADLESHGVLAWEKNASGFFSPYADTMTDGTTDVFVTRMADYIAESIGNKLENFRGAINDTETIQDERSLIDTFGRKLVSDNKVDHITLPNIKAWMFLPVEAVNSESTLDAGEIHHAAIAQLWSDEKQLFLRLQVGTSVTVTPVATP
jgi:hypothetical protein